MDNTNAAEAAPSEFEDDALGATEESGEFEGGALAGNNEFDAYEKTGKLGDADDQADRRVIEEGTRVTLGVMGFALITKNNRVLFKFEVVAPQEFVGSETNFRESNGLDTKTFESGDGSPWLITKNTIARIVAAVYHKPLKDAAVNDFLDPAYLAVQTIKDPLEKRRKFYVALVNLLNEELKGKTFQTYLGVQAAQGKYKAQQRIGAPQYPGCRKYEKPDAR